MTLQTVEPAQALAARTDGLYRWLLDQAMPVWTGAGYDARTGAFAEALDQERRPTSTVLRARVQARQIYVLCAAGRLGWQGPWAEMAARAMDFFLARFQRSDGAFRFSIGPDDGGNPEAMFYEQAFSLLAMAHVAAVQPGRQDVRLAAHRLLDGHMAERRLSQGGFREGGDRPYQSNPHMHLLEAALAWEAAEPDGPWAALADEVATLAAERFIDPDRGFLREFFNADWTPAGGEAGRVVEPGHQFEWCWLLRRWGQRRPGAPLEAQARRLFEIGVRHGVDPERNVAIDELDSNLDVLTPTARLWPQTERIKAALAMAEVGDSESALREAAAGVDGLRPYLDTPGPGLWRDRMVVDGSLVAGTAPATSLYHIVGAIEELARWRGQFAAPPFPSERP
ncbi:AGE family epimerase/isomerase [Caulobacter sp. CCUG 60055]|uniref:AGE family epimerase/isomerase n=1 Tax=Caulobacter sp. CCUG 60055 TaxID=2100090 RepID=UPI001FA77F01